MALHIHRPILCAFKRPAAYSSQHVRTFTCKSPRWAKQAAISSTQARQKPQQSIQTTKKQQGNVPSDLGLLEGLFIMPTGANRPSLFAAPRTRLKLEWTRLIRFGRDLLGLYAYKRIIKPKKMLHLKETAPTAIALHRRMYTAFAAGDVHTLRKICADGILETFRKRIATRGGETWNWTLHSYERSPRVVSNRAARLPMDKSGLRQAVVKIESRQSLEKRGPDGDRVLGTGREKVIVEYFVIQKQMLDGKEGPWLVWGTTEESSLSKLLEEEKRDM